MSNISARINQDFIPLMVPMKSVRPLVARAETPHASLRSHRGITAVGLCPPHGDCHHVFGVSIWAAPREKTFQD